MVTKPMRLFDSYDYEDDCLMIKKFDTFIYTYYKIKNIDSQAAHKIVDIKFSIMPYDHVGLIDCRFVRWLTLNAMKILSNERAKKYIVASAVVGVPKIARVLGNIYYEILSPPFPSRLYTNLGDAVLWLKEVANIEISSEFNEIIVNKDFDVNSN